jgi:hypothetical protein
MIFVDLGAVLIMLALAGSVVSIVRSDKTKAKEAEKLRWELQCALNSRNKATLQDFLVLWNDRLTTEQKDAIKARIDDMTIQENP